MKRFCCCGLLIALAAPWTAVPVRADGRFMESAYMYSKLEAQRCLENQLKLYRCLSAYASKHQGRLPAGNNFEGLRQLGAYGADFTLFRCGESRVKRAKSNNDLHERCNPFIYFGGMNLEEMRKAAPNAPLLMDKPGSRHLNIVYVNGQTETIEADKISRKNSTCRQVVAALHGRYNYPPEVLAALLLKADAIDKTLSKR